MTEKNHKKVRVPTVAVGVQVLETRLDVAIAQGLGPNQLAAADGVRRLLRKAEEAAYGVDPSPGAVSRWWSGALVDAANQNLHAARAQMIDVYDDAEIAAEIPAALGRMQQTLHRDDVRRRMADSGISSDVIERQRAFLRRAIEDSYDALDRQHERLRSFRNIILLLALCIAVLVVVTIIVVWTNPAFMPLCFPSDGLAPDGSSTLNCPTGEGFSKPHGNDIIVVALLGLLGGALAAAVSIRNLRGTSTPYDVPVALSLLKVPLGAFTAILGLVAIQGDFVPGLSALDSQQQILAYALVLGYGQQVFTYSLDRKAQTLLDGLPAKDGSAPPVGGGGDSLPTVETAAYRLERVVPTQAASTGNGDGSKRPSDDAEGGSVTMPKAKATDHRS
ncbi:MAG: hypothetical protein QOF58_4034 [Pseudonocardiales bacterium]|nr:hypothetical protein [Pseudonocardiales bacterium]